MTKAYPIHIRFNDLDTYGHVNNAVYITYFEEGRSLWFQDRVGQKWNWTKHGILLAKHEVEYKVPLLLTDDAFIKLWISKIGTKSFEVSYLIYKNHNGHELECTTGKSVAVCFDYQTQKTIEIPKEWLEIFKEDIKESD
ncbi:MAG: acyl-CoA thioesterase [Flavobacteriales bacterium]|nr:acyl-CoA thioesterase [Flavobacteriales bacterium]